MTISKQFQSLSKNLFQWTKRNGSILIVLGIFLTALLTLFISPSINTINTQDKLEGDYYFKNIKITQLELIKPTHKAEYIPLDTTWELVADTAEIHLKQDKLTLMAITANMFENKKRAATISAPSGFLLLSTNKVTLHNSNATLLLNNNHSQLTSNLLTWTPANTQLKAVGNVKLISPPYDIQSDYAELNTLTQQLKMESNVQADYTIERSLYEKNKIN